jgi:hypothetical protein
VARRWAIQCALLYWGLIGCKGKPAAETKIPEEEVDRKNPIESRLLGQFSVSASIRTYERGQQRCAHLLRSNALIFSTGAVIISRERR